jgi:hypothetical protein
MNQRLINGRLIAYCVVGLSMARLASGADKNLQGFQTGAISWGMSKDGQPTTAPFSAAPIAEFVHSKIVRRGATTHPLYLENLPSLMRVEAAVLYFHVPMMTSDPFAMDIRTSILNGMITDHYPFAMENLAPRSASIAPRIPGPEGNVDGGIEWVNIRVGEAADSLETSSSRWIALRGVSAAAPNRLDCPGPPGRKPTDEITTEGEVFAFARGIGNVRAPLLIKHEGTRFTISRFDDRHTTERIAAVWYAEFKNGGTGAYYHAGELNPGKDVFTSAPDSFDASKYVPSAGSDLRDELRQAMDAEGSDSEESRAMLAFVGDDWFGKAGRRFLFVVPSGWADKFLPLEIKGNARMAHRVFIGRIELVD